MKYILIALVFIATACTKKIENKASENDIIENKVDSLLSVMTLKEKIGQMIQLSNRNGLTSPEAKSNIDQQIKEGFVGSMLNVDSVYKVKALQEIAVNKTRLGIPLLFGYDIIHGWRTMFPVPIAESASWDLEAIKTAARVGAIEGSASGQNWTFAPMVDIARDPRWGRIVEGAGEDPYLGSKIAAARVRGIQGDNLKANNTIAACAKHFAAYGAAEGGRDYNTVDVSERVLRDIYLPPFKAAVDAGVLTIMTAFNEISGVPCTANKFLLSQVLRKELGFKGFVVSDANSVGEMIEHGFAENNYQATKLAVNAGCDMDMNSQSYYHELFKAVKNGDVPKEHVNESVRRILKVKFKLGLFEDPYRYCDLEREKKSMLTPEHHKIAREVAKKTFVLLENKTKILPLNKNIQKIAVIGALANSGSDMNGSWKAKGKSKEVITLLEGIKNKVSSSTKVAYAKGCNINDNYKSNFDKAIKIAKDADVIILAIGESARMSAENRSKANIEIPEIQLKLAKKLHKLNKPIVAVLFNGRPVAIKWLSDNIPSIIEGWFPGTEAGNALADVIFGDYNPSGKLPVSFPIVTGQSPLYYNYKATGRPIRESTYQWQTKYIDVPNKPLYPFGYGLSYSTFEYSDLKLNKKEIKFSENLEISIKIKNTSDYDGHEIAQLYVQDLFGSVTRPIKELKRFKKVFIKKRTSKDITFTINSDDLKFHDINMDYIAEAGKFKIFVGGNSVDVTESEFVLTKK